MTNRSDKGNGNTLWATIVISFVLVLYSISEHHFTSHISIKLLGKTEDGRVYNYRKPGRQHEYSAYELCKRGDKLEIFKQGQCKDQVALVRFKNAVNITGLETARERVEVRIIGRQRLDYRWSFLEIETNSEHSPLEQAYAAGYLEGALTRKLIQHQIHNVLSNYCTGKEAYCEKLRNFIKENHIWTKKFLNRAPTKDPYNSAIHRTYYQLQGLIDAYEKRPAVARATFEYHPIVFLNWMGEFYDLEVKFNKTRAGTEIPEKCSALVKLAPNNRDLFFAHVTMFAYHQMLRVIKLYKFGYDKKAYPGRTIAFTSYPGLISSQDDFHITSAKLAVMETTIGVYDPSKMLHTQSQEQLPSWIRSMTASLLANSAPEWIDVFLRYHMGTYNNQWMIVDYKLFTPGEKKLKEHTFYVLETMPHKNRRKNLGFSGYFVFRDKTSELQEATYHPSYNLPHYQEIIDYSALERFAKTFDHPDSEGIGGDYYRSGKSPRAKIFARDHSSVVDFESFTKLLRKIDFKSDELSRCACQPPYTGEAAIAARGDLNDPHGKYEFPAIGHRNHGALDFKGVNHERIEEFSFRAWGAPAWDREHGVPPFQWTQFEKSSPIRVPHRGHPDLFDFEFVEVEFEALHGKSR